MKREVRRWMRPSGWGVEPPYFAVYRNCFEIKSPVTLRFEYSADERATLFCDGKVVAEGPARGTVERWYSATVEIPLEPGKHVLTARLLAFGKIFSKVLCYFPGHQIYMPHIGFLHSIILYDTEMPVCSDNSANIKMTVCLCRKVKCG